MLTSTSAPSSLKEEDQFQIWARDVHRRFWGNPVQIEDGHIVAPTLFPGDHLFVRDEYSKIYASIYSSLGLQERLSKGLVVWGDPGIGKHASSHPRRT